MSSETNKGPNLEKLTLTGFDEPPSGIYFVHTKRNRQVTVETDNMEPGGVSDEIIDAVFEIAALNNSSVLTILEEHGFDWGPKERRR